MLIHVIPDFEENLNEKHIRESYMAYFIVFYLKLYSF